MSLNDRKLVYGQIHQAAHTLELTEDARRNIYRSLTGQTTLVDMRPSELETVKSFLVSEATAKGAHPSDCFCDECALSILN